MQLIQSTNLLTINRLVDDNAAMRKPATVHAIDRDEDPENALLDRVFFALSDPVRRRILERLDRGSLLVSELAAPFAISLQAVSRHIQVLVRAGLITQERTGRISRCSLAAGPVFAASLWINRYSKYWQAQFDVLAVALHDIEERRSQEKDPATQDPPQRKPTRARRRPISS
jgi:DNA-binding transcriptional ArsR family regulator